MEVSLTTGRMELEVRKLTRSSLLVLQRVACGPS